MRLSLAYFHCKSSSFDEKVIHGHQDTLVWKRNDIRFLTRIYRPKDTSDNSHI